MSLALITQPTFLKKHFSYTREGLLGQWPIIGHSKRFQEFSRQGEAIVQAHFPPITVARQAELPVQLEIRVAEPQRLPNQRQLLLERTPVSTPSSSWWKPAAKFTLSIIVVVCVTLGAVIILPEIYYSVFSTSISVNEVATAAKQTAQLQPIRSLEPEPYLPPQNPDLPTGVWVSIPRIGVYSEVRATENPTEALDTGVWMVPDFGRPGDYSQPAILAAHRYGWDWWWKTDYWKYNSFYLLTDTEPGDQVEVIYDQRKWVYEIYAVEEGELITDYDADLILYTCKFINSPIRYFRYAKVIVPR